MNDPRIMLAAPASGSGKTLITCGILQALVNRGLKTASFKCGPDYIDPMFHERVIGTRSGNLDTFFTDGETTRYLFGKAASGMDISVVEGVMGYYDGLGGISVEGSSYDVARTISAPVVLIVNCRGQSLSALPALKGFLEYREPSMIKGVIFNQMSPMLYKEIKTLAEEQLPIRVLGYVPSVKELNLESRHLGLVLPGEVEALKEKLKNLAEILEETLDLEGFLELAREAPELAGEKPAFLREIMGQAMKGRAADDGRELRKQEPGRQTGQGSDRGEAGQTAPLRIALAKDEAFCFTYRDNLGLLGELGAKLVEFSPLRDSCLPQDCCGLILSGGYPELHARKLSENEAMRASIREAVEGGMPCIAECGGFLYLHEGLEGQDGEFYPMAGVIAGKSCRRDRLGRFGYISLTAQKEQMLLAKGETVKGHEFHYWESENCGEAMLAEKPKGGKTWLCAHGSPTLYAGFPHLFYYSNPQVPLNFLRKCEEYLCLSL